MDESQLIVVFWIPGVVVPKQRPRTQPNSRIPRLPEKYRKWKQSASGLLALQVSHRGLSQIMPLDYPVSVESYFCGFGTGDSDNLLGSVLDALNDAKIIKNDTRRWVPDSLAKTATLARDKQAKGCLVKLYRHTKKYQISDEEFIASTDEYLSPPISYLVN